MAYDTVDIRNIALVGHAAAGKTTLADALLAAAGRIATAGDVTRGDTVCDYDSLEKERGHSLDTLTKVSLHQIGATLWTPSGIIVL